MALHRTFNMIGWALAFGIIGQSHGFVLQRLQSPPVARTSKFASSTQVDDTSPVANIEDANADNDAVVKSPMRFLGPYPTMPLRL